MKKLLDVIQKQGYYIIAEIGVNYYDIAEKKNLSNMEAAKLMCKEAKVAGADAVKFQTYKAEKIASKFSPSYWDTTEEPITSQYDLFKKYDSFGEKEFTELSLYCNEIGLTFMSTPFDFEAADYLDNMIESYKISSSDITNFPFIHHICAKKKLILLSTGASEEREIEEAVEIVKEYGNELVLMHCVLEYPTPDIHANLLRITVLREKYPELIIGYSDHTKPEHDYAVVKTAFVLGAKVIEKHFTLDKTLKGNDHYHAMDPDDLRNMKVELEYLKAILGQGSINSSETESVARKNARRSIVLLRDMKKGERLTEKDISFKRPGTGISPKDYEKVIDRYINKNLMEDSILQWEDIVF